MDTLEEQLHYVYGDTVPGPGAVLDVAPGVRWARMALPFALNHVNLWLLRDEVDGRGGWTVVDCGIDTPQAREQWERIFAEGMQGLPVLRVLVTHMHPDHIGLAHWLCERWNAPLLISATDYYAARLGSGGPGAGGEAAAAFFASHGLAEGEALDLIRQRAGYYRSMVPAVPSRFRRLMDGTSLSVGCLEWICIAGYGHAPEHMALYCPRTNVLIGGDMMLPRISTNISVSAAEPDANPLDLFLGSIDWFRDLPADVLALPSHGKPFTGVHTRINQLQAHHAGRLDALHRACAAAPKTAADALPLLFNRALDAHQMAFAMGEAVAHMNHLWLSGRVRRVEADGIYRFIAAG